MSDEEWEVEAGWRAKCDITEEELSYAQNLWRRQRLPNPERLDDWLRVMEEIVGVIGSAYCSSFKLLKSNHVKNESLLELLRAVYTSVMAEVDIIKGDRT
jgi:hypothetical protein